MTNEPVRWPNDYFCNTLLLQMGYEAHETVLWFEETTGNAWVVILAHRLSLEERHDVVLESSFRVLTKFTSPDDELSKHQRKKRYLSFVQSVTYHVVMEVLRSTNRKKLDPKSEPNDLEALDEETLAKREVHRLLGVWLADPALDGRDLTILTLRYMCGLSFGQIAEICAMTASAVRIIHHRALQKLRAIVARLNPEYLDDLPRNEEPESPDNQE